MKKIIAIFLVVIMLIGCLAGCSKDSPNISNGDNSGSGNSNGNKEIVFHYSHSEDLQNVNVFNDGSGLINGSMWKLVYGELIHSDHRGTYTPALLTEWEPSEDGLAWSLTLRDGITFENGTPFTSRALKVAWEYAASDPSLNAYNTWQYVSEVEIVDDLHCIVHTTEVLGTFVSTLSSAFYVEPNLFEELGPDEYWKAPMGCGPFRFVSWQPGNGLVLEKIDDYVPWDGSEPTNVDRFEFTPISEDITRISALETGEMQMILGIPYEQYGTVENIKDTTFVQMAGSQTLYIAFQGNPASPCSDINFRKAISMCIDRELIASTIYSNAQALSQNVPPFAIENQDGKDGEFFKYDLEKAKEYLAQSDYNGETLVVLVPSTWYPKVTELIQTLTSMFGEIGVKCDFQLKENAAFTEARKSGEWDLLIPHIRFGTDNSYWFMLQFGMNTGSYNYQMINQEAVDMMAEAYHTIDEAKKAEIVAEYFEMMKQDVAPMTPILVWDTCAAYNNDWEGLEVYPDNVPDFLNLRYAG